MPSEIHLIRFGFCFWKDGILGVSSSQAWTRGLLFRALLWPQHIIFLPRQKASCHEFLHLSAFGPPHPPKHSPLRLQSKVVCGYVSVCLNFRWNYGKTFNTSTINTIQLLSTLPARPWSAAHFSATAVECCDRLWIEAPTRWRTSGSG